MMAVSTSKVQVSGTAITNVVVRQAVSQALILQWSRVVHCSIQGNDTPARWLSSSSSTWSRHFTCQFYRGLPINTSVSRRYKTGTLSIAFTTVNVSRQPTGLQLTSSRSKCWMGINFFDSETKKKKFVVEKKRNMAAAENSSALLIFGARLIWNSS